MALSQSTLATELENLVPTASASTAATTLAQAYGDYMKGAESNAVPITSASVDSLAVPAMAAAMTFTAGDTSAQGAAQFVAGLAAFWGAMVAAPASFFTGATVITPPPFTTTAASLATDFDNNTSNEETLADSAAALAATIHGDTDGIGTATFPGPTVAPIT